MCKGLHMTQSNVSMHLKNLVAMGYIRRPKTQTYIPVYLPDGKPVPTVIEKLPDGVAVGYKPLTQKIGNIGRLPT